MESDVASIADVANVPGDEMIAMGMFV